jgi:hypothetical protein
VTRAIYIECRAVGIKNRIGGRARSRLGSGMRVRRHLVKHLGEYFMKAQEALAEARRRWGHAATIHTAPNEFVETVVFYRVGTGKRWFLADLLGVVSSVKGEGLTWEPPSRTPIAKQRRGYPGVRRPVWRVSSSDQFPLEVKPCSQFHLPIATASSK